MWSWELNRTWIWTCVPLSDLRSFSAATVLSEFIQKYIIIYAFLIIDPNRRSILLRCVQGKQTLMCTYPIWRERMSRFVGHCWPKTTPSLAPLSQNQWPLACCAQMPPSRCWWQHSVSSCECVVAHIYESRSFRLTFVPTQSGLRHIPTLIIVFQYH